MLLSHTDCEKIHEAALDVLNDLGVRVDDPAIVKLLAEAGAAVTGDNRVRIPARLVEWALQQAPHRQNCRPPGPPVATGTGGRHAGLNR